MQTRLLLVLAIFGALIAPARAGLVWGANGHPFYAYPGIPVQEQLDYVADLGMKSYRVNISGPDKEAELIALVKEAKKRDIDILPVVTPNLDLDRMSPQDLYDASFKMAVALVSPLKGDIRVWELGNEIENYALLHPCEMRDDHTKYPCDFGIAGGKDPLDYYGTRWAKVSAVLKGLSDGVASVDPTIRKAIGTAGWGHIGAFARMKRDGIKWDISVWHAYGEDPEWAFKALARYGHPIWLTEFDQPNGSQNGEQVQADGLRKQMLRLRDLASRYPLQAAFVYELLDEPYWAPGAEASMGLVHLLPKGGGWMLGDPKPAYLAVKQVIKDQIFFPTPARLCDLKAEDRRASSVGATVRYNYCMLLGGAPSTEDLATWTALLDEQKTDPLRMVLTLLNSDEFRQRYHPFALTNGTYLGLVYQLLLGRSPDGYGFKTYLAQLNSGDMSRNDLVAGIVYSSEFRLRHPILFAKVGLSATGKQARKESD